MRLHLRVLQCSTDCPRPLRGSHVRLESDTPPNRMWAHPRGSDSSNQNGNRLCAHQRDVRGGQHCAFLWWRSLNRRKLHCAWPLPTLTGAGKSPKFVFSASYVDLSCSIGHVLGFISLALRKGFEGKTGGNQQCHFKWWWHFLVVAAEPSQLTPGEVQTAPHTCR